MRVLIFENQFEGHRLQFARMCIDAVADAAGPIVLATGAHVPATDEFRTHLSAVLDRIELDTGADPRRGESGPGRALTGTGAKPDARPRSALRTAAARLRALRRAIRRIRPDHVYIPYADGVAQLSGLTPLDFPGRPPIEIEGILMRGRFAYPRDSWRDALAARVTIAALARSPFIRLHFLDPIPYEVIERRGGRLAARARLIPEPVEPPAAMDRTEARRRLGLDLRGRWVCCPGWLDERKGVDRLIRAFAAAALRPDDRLLLIGRVAPAVRAALLDAAPLLERGRIILHEGCVSDEHLHTAMAAADLVAAPYPRHIGSSGIIVRAAALGRMLLASDFGWVGMVTARFGLGLICDCRDERAIARALPGALDAASGFRPTEAGERFSRFHTQANFARHLSARLRERLGRTADSRPPLTWAWVNEAIERGSRSSRPVPAAAGPR